MDSKRKVNHLFSNNPQRIRLRGRPKADGGTICKQILINAQLKTRKRVQKTDLTGEVH
jgi:hypothetical protein